MSTGKRSGPVGAVMFNLRLGLKAESIDIDLPDNTAGWRSECEDQERPGGRWMTAPR
jgi:hypothetical protein